VRPFRAWLFSGLFFIGIAALRTWPLFAEPNISCVSPNSDGIGSLGGWFTFIEDADNAKAKILLSDVYAPTSIGLGLIEPGPFSIVWKNIIYFLSRFFSVENIWSVIVFGTFVLHGLVGLALARELGAGWLLAIFAGLFFQHLDLFVYRIAEHLTGLATYFMPILLILLAIRAAKKPTWLRLIFLGLGAALNFSFNEYYGYFGSFICAAIFIGFAIFSRKKWAISGIPFFMRTLAGGVAFFLAMILLYPVQIGARLNGLFQPKSSEPAFVEPMAHVKDEFLYFTIDNFWHIFEPSVGGLKNIFRAGFFDSSIWEYTFRVGFLLPAAILVCVAVLLATRPGRKQLADVFWPTFLVFMATILAIPFAIPDKYKLSLVNFTYHLGQIFRVGLRSLVYLDIGIILLYVLVFGAFQKLLGAWLSARFGQHKGQWISRAVIVIISMAVLCDLYSQRIWSPLPASKLPSLKAYERLSKMPNGALLELPYFSSVHEQREDNYIYNYHRIGHDKPLINMFFSSTFYPNFVGPSEEFTELANHALPRIIDRLSRAGVRYVAVSKDALSKGKITFAGLEAAPRLKLISEDSSVSIYEIEPRKDFDTSSFVDEFLMRGSPSIFFSVDCHFLPPLLGPVCGKSGGIMLRNLGDSPRQYSLEINVDTRSAGQELMTKRVLEEVTLAPGQKRIWSLSSLLSDSLKNLPPDSVFDFRRIELRSKSVGY